MKKTREQVRDENSSIVIHLENQIKLLNKALKQEKNAKGGLQNALNQILSNVTICDPVKIEYKKPKKLSVTNKESAVIHCTDWHIGKDVVADEVNQMGEYNYDIATRRVEHITQAKIEDVELERRGASINELVIFDTGDMQNGALRPGDIATNEFPVAVQTVKAAELFAAMVMMYAPHFTTVRVEVVVPDNHSRIGKKVESTEPFNNFHYLMAELAKAKTSRQKNVVWNIHPGLLAETKVQNMRYIFRHGHGLTGGSLGGIPYYAIDRQLAKEAMGRLGLDVNYQFDKLIMGHYHTEFNSPHARMSPSLSGTDNFDRMNGRNSKPGQCGWTVHPKHGEKNYNLYGVGDIV